MLSARRFHRQRANRSKIIGTDVDGTANLTAGYVLCQLFQAEETAQLTDIEVYCRANSNVIVGLYDSNGTHPANLLTQSASTAITAEGWRRISVPAISLTAGTYYWLAGTCDVTGGLSNTAPANSGVYSYKLRSYQALPSVNADSVLYNNYLIAIRGLRTL